MAPRKKGAVELKLLLQIDDLLEEISLLKQERDEAQARAVSAEVGDSSGIVEVVNEAEGEVVELAENILFRALTAREAYFLGRMVQGFGPERVANALRRKRNTVQPIRGAYAMLNAGAMGKPAKTKEAPAAVTYASADDYTY